MAVLLWRTAKTKYLPIWETEGRRRRLQTVHDKTPTRQTDSEETGACVCGSYYTLMIFSVTLPYRLVSMKYDVFDHRTFGGIFTVKRTLIKGCAEKTAY
jgi:hypothetical protein